MEHNPQIFRSFFQNDTNIHVLQDETLILDGIRYYGSSWQCQWDGTGFYLERGSDELKSKWVSIPEKTQVLITHAPSVGDSLDDKPDDDLYKRVLKVKPVLHIFGHVHEGSHGVIHQTWTRLKTHETTFIKASICDDEYRVVHIPIVFDLHL